MKNWDTIILREEKVYTYIWPVPNSSDRVVLLDMFGNPRILSKKECWGEFNWNIPEVTKDDIVKSLKSNKKKKWNSSE